MDSQGQTLLSLVIEVRRRQRRMDAAGGFEELSALRTAERQLDAFIDSLTRPRETVYRCEHGIDMREHCPKCKSRRKRR